MEISEQKFAFRIVHTDYETAVECFTLTEQVSQPYTLTVTLVCDCPIDFDEVMEREAVLTILGKSVDRFVHGVIANFAFLGLTDRFYTYEATVVPSLWMLSFNQNFRVFQNLSTMDIVKKILHENGVVSDRYDFRLQFDYRSRRYCTQYGESDFHFICRILEEEGIFFFFQHAPDGHSIIFSDTSLAFVSIDGDSEVVMANDSGMVAESEAIFSFTHNRSIRPGKVTHSNYNFKRPSLSMAVTVKDEGEQVRDFYEYPGSYALPEQGKAKVKAHLQEVSSLRETGQGLSTCARFMAGATFVLEGHDLDRLNAEYALVSVEHEGAQPNVYAEQSGIGGEYTYSNRFIAIPAETSYRPSRSVAKPLVVGLQSAVVTGPRGEEIYTDEYGRVKVKFHWDLREGADEQSSCWLRTSQSWSGCGWGMVSLPRVGDEVLVAFINGDPDWPIVVGNVNNALSPALYPLPANKSQSGIRTRSTPAGSRDNYNELRFEDRKGSEEIYLQGERDWNILIKNNKGEVIGHDETLLVQNDRTKTVQMNQKESIGINNTVRVGADQLEEIGVNMRLSVGTNKAEEVGANSVETVGAAKAVNVGEIYRVSVGGAMDEAVGGAKTEEVGMVKSVVVGADMCEKVAGSRQLQVGQDLIIDAGQSFQIKCGSGVFRMDSNGRISINGIQLDLNASGTARIRAKNVQTN